VKALSDGYIKLTIREQHEVVTDRFGEFLTADIYPSKGKKYEVSFGSNDLGVTGTLMDFTEVVPYTPDTFGEGEKESYVIISGQACRGAGDYAAADFPVTAILRRNSPTEKYVFDNRATTAINRNGIATQEQIELYLDAKLALHSGYDRLYNPIDLYFTYLPSSITASPVTSSMVIRASTEAAAWKSEMDHCYAMLENRAHGPARDYLLKEQKAYVDYASNSAEVDGLIAFSDAFVAEGKGEATGLSIGTDAGVESESQISDLYKEKTLSLFDRLSRIGVKPRFIFDKAAEDKIMEKQFPDEMREYLGTSD